MSPISFDHFAIHEQRTKPMQGLHEFSMLLWLWAQRKYWHVPVTESGNWCAPCNPNALNAPLIIRSWCDFVRCAWTSLSHLRSATPCLHCCNIYTSIWDITPTQIYCSEYLSLFLACTGVSAPCAQSSLQPLALGIYVHPCLFSMAFFPFFSIYNHSSEISSNERNRKKTICLMIKRTIKSSMYCSLVLYSQRELFLKLSPLHHVSW